MFDLHERVATPLTTDILERIGTLYGIEAEVRGRPPDVRLAARQNRTKPLVGPCALFGHRFTVAVWRAAA